jgi:hypothetical protein
MKKVRKLKLYKGLPLIDADRDLHICITKTDVNSSKKNDPANCAAANAVKRELKTEVEVHISRTYVKRGNKWVRFNTPCAIGREITAFDRGAAFEPGDYVLKAVPASNRLGVKHHGNTHTETGQGNKRRPHHVTANIRESAR